ncbi:LCP family protein [Acutalibacter caecimuris]|uniref:LCP family protein n=1 Tax=Acutalibacter caecimuris TaxID=3093657 RepID=UPI002AC95FED|nr:LCP family protein [Acutalibacter sp. M00118]
MAQKERERPRREPLKDNYYYDMPPLREFEDISSYSSEKRRSNDKARMARRPARPPQPRRARRRMGAGKKILLVLILLVVAGVGVTAYMFMGLRTHSLQGDLGIYQGARVDGVKNIALFGLDSRDWENQGRSDAVMVLSLDSRNHTMKMASLMRDSYVYIEGYGYDKLAHAYAYGGPELAVRTLNQNFHLDIEDYVTVNFYKMAEIVDAFGGVELELTGEEMLEVNRNLWNLSKEVERDGGQSGIKYEDYFDDLDGTHNMVDGTYAGGKVLLNGHQAVAYARIRYIDSDEGRTSRQHRVLTGLVARAKQRSVLAWPGIAHGMMPHCETSLNAMDMAALVPFALGGFETQSITLPGENENAYGSKDEGGNWIYCFDEDLARAHLHGFLYE